MTMYVGILCWGLAWVTVPAQAGVASPLDRLALDVSGLSEVERQKIPPGCVGILGSLQGRHDSIVTSLAVGRDGTRVASASQDDSVRVWEADTLKLLRSYPHPDTVTAVSWSADQSQLLSVCKDGVLRAWEMGDSKPIYSVQVGGKLAVTNFSTDGSHCVSADRPEGAEGVLKIRVIKLSAEGQDRTTRLLRWPDMYSLSKPKFSEERRWLAALGVNEDRQSQIALWDLTDDNPTPKTILTAKELPKKLNGFTSVDFSQDSAALVAGSESGKLYVWNLSGGKPIETESLQEHQDEVTAIQFSPNGKHVASASYDGSILVRTWPIDPSEKPTQLEAHRSRVTDLRFAPDGTTLYSCSNDHTVRRSRKTQTGYEVSLLVGHTHDVSAIAWAPDGRIATGAESHRPTPILLWTVQGREFVVFRRIPNLSGEIKGLAFSGDGKRLAGADRVGIRAWTLSPFKAWPVLKRVNQRGEVCIAKSVKFQRAQPLVYSGWLDGTVQVAALLSSGLKHLATVKPVYRSPETLCVARETGQVAIATGGEVLLLDSRTLEETGKFLIQENRGIQALDISSGGKYVAAGLRDGTVHIIATRDGKVEQVLSGHRRRLTSVAFGDRNQILASACISGRLCVWDRKSGKKVSQWEFGRISALAFAPDGRHLAVADGSGLVWLLRLKNS